MSDIVVKQTNLYATQTAEGAPDDPHTRPWNTIDRDTLERYLSVRIVLGLLHVPSYAWAWSDSELSSNDVIKRVMPLQQFEQITRFLHCANSVRDTLRGHPNHDTLYKVRPILERFKKNCKTSFSMDCEVSMDEMDLAFQGQHPDKECITYKRVGDGFLVYSSNDAHSGYTFDFNPKMCNRWNKNIAGFTITFSAVLAVLESLEGKWHHVFCDNLYGNLRLAEECFKRGILWTSTMRVDRLRTKRRNCV